MHEKSTAIEGVMVQPLRQILDDRGAVLHMLRRDSPLFKGFGEIYFSQTNPGVIKAWKRHRLMRQNFAVPVGLLLLVVHDDRPESTTCGQTLEIILGRPDDYQLVHLPPMVWYGFQGIASTPTLLANCANLPHDPTESETRPFDHPQMPILWRVG